MGARSSRVLFAATAAILAIAAVACVTPPPRPTGYLQSYGGLLPQPPPCATVYGERTSAGKVARVDHVLQVLPSRWDAERLKKPEREQKLLDLLDLRLMIYLLRAVPSSVIVTTDRDVEDYLKAGVNVTQLRLSITDVEKGVGLLRLLVGMYLGAAEIQIEGRLVDLRTGKVLARFARRGRSDGAVFFLPTPQALSPYFCWRLAIDQSARLIAAYVASQLTPPPPRWWERLSDEVPAASPVVGKEKPPTSGGAK